LDAIIGADGIVTCVVLVFLSAKTAEYSVAGVPAVARAAREIALAADSGPGISRCQIVVPGDWKPSAWCLAELTRLAPDLDWRIGESISRDFASLYVCGEQLVASDTIRAALSGVSISSSNSADVTAGGSEEQVLAGLRHRGKAIIAATGKAGDGIVSRYLNRPVSQSISRVLLRYPGVTPFHATLGTMALGLAMAFSLFFGGEKGAIIGALLFQAASIFDGVDGEIARATFRSSRAGALLDSVTDAVTNLAFIAGLTINLWQQGLLHAAAAGAAGLAMLATGLFLIGLRTRASDGPFTFDLIKNHFRGRKSPLMQCLTWLAMRDFFAAAGALLILLGLAPYALIAFSVVTAGWLAVTLTVLSRTAHSAPALARPLIGSVSE